MNPRPNPSHLACLHSSWKCFGFFLRIKDFRILGSCLTNLGTWFSFVVWTHLTKRSWILLIVNVQYFKKKPPKEYPCYIFTSKYWNIIYTYYTFASTQATWIQKNGLLPQFSLLSLPFFKLLWIQINTQKEKQNNSKNERSHDDLYKTYKEARKKDQQQKQQKRSELNVPA